MIAPRPPVYPKPKPERPQRGKTVTISASVMVADGVIMCADRMVSHGDFAHYDLKLFGVRGDNFAAIGTGAGDYDAITSITEGFLHSIVSAKGNTQMDDIPRKLEDFLAEKLRNVSDPHVWLLFAFMKDDGIYDVWSSYNCTVRHVSPSVPEVIGIGDNSLIRYLADSLYHLSLTLKQGIALAVYIVWAAKKYCPAYCGGPTDIWVLGKQTASSIALWKVVPASTILALEEILQRGGAECLKNTLNLAAQSITY